MQPTRRQVLVAGVALTAACTTKSTPQRHEPTRDERLRAEAVAREQALVEAYEPALEAHPELARLLSPVLADHAVHLYTLGGARPVVPTAPPAARSRAAVLRDLVAREKEAGLAHAAAAELAETDVSCGRVLAPLLASLAASEASHAAVLA